MLACRAPSVHNSQPGLGAPRGWRFIYLLIPSGSCGSPIEQAEKCSSAVERYSTTLMSRWPRRAGAPLSTDSPRPMGTITWPPCTSVPCPASTIHRPGVRMRSLKRRTDRLPLPAPAGWNALVSAFRNEVSNHDVTLAVVADDDREQLAQASQLTEALRRQDLTYQSELRWWTSPFNLDEGVPAGSRLSTSGSPPALTLPVHFRRSGTAISGGGGSTSTTRRSLCCVRA